MPNERLRGQLAARGQTIHDLASAIEVDPKTVERWITLDRLPHRRHRRATAQLLQIEESYLWPEAANSVRTQSATEAEFLSLYPTRATVPQHLWRSLIDSTRRQLEILVYAGTFLLDGNPDLPRLLAIKAEQGTKVRLLLGDPDSDAVAARGIEEGIGDGLAGRIRTNLSYLTPVLGLPGLDLRLHRTPLYNSLFRFDDDLLVNLHTYGTGAPQNPVMHLRRLPDGRLFPHFMSSFETVWSTARPLASTSAA